jgi:glycosyltransferase involved in cell wall biosynthesis
VRILHVEGGRHLYGGAQQVLYILNGLSSRGVENGLVCPLGSELVDVAAACAEVFPLPMSGDLDLRLVPRIRRLIRDFRADLVHLHSRIGADVMGGIAGRLARVPTVHSRRVDNPEPRWRVAVKYRLHDRVIAISRGIGEVLTREGLPAAKLRVVRSAVDVDRFDHPCDRQSVCERLDLPSHARLIGVVAQLIARKGHRFLIDALPPLVARHPDLLVLFLGQGPETRALKQRIRERGLGGTVRFGGFRDDLPDLLPCLQMLVHPATMEGLGVSLLQASSAGVPIVASRVGGIPEAVRDGVNGLLVPAADVEALGNAVGRLLEDRPLAARLGEAGRSLMRAEFSIDAMVEGNLAVYRELLPEVPGGRSRG